MSDSKKLDFKLAASNIGPLTTFSFDGKIGSCKIGIFANNGSGKTFLSRMFRIAGTPDQELDKINDLLTIDAAQGDFSFSLKNPRENGRTRSLGIKIKRDDPNASITNSTDYLFHAFNSDYVRENIEEREYSADGTVEGYILGKGNIDLSKELKELVDLESKLEALTTDLRNALQKEKNKLDALSIRKNLGDYTFFTYENIGINPRLQEAQTFAELKVLHKDLKALPDDLPDLSQLIEPSRISDFEGISLFLETSYSKSSLAEDFVKEVKSKQVLVEEALKASNGEDCPFCGQTYTEEAAQLIRRYNRYLDDEEAKVAKRCESLVRTLKQDLRTVEKSLANALNAAQSFNEQKKFIPSLKKETCDSYQPVESLSEAIKEICTALENKAQNIDRVGFNIESASKRVDEYTSDLSKTIANNQSRIDLLNSTKNNVQHEKRELDRRLCRALFIETKSALAGKIEDVSKLQECIQALELGIREKETQVRIEKKQKVAESLIQFLNLFFDGKYSFDDEKYSITFQGKSLGKKVAKVLSDGEKSIVSFCHYLAETHVLLTTDDDYKRLFFIIDDPISSLDFHYVYAVAQVIRNIGDYFDLQGNARFIVLTHNIEFMSILCRNKIVSQRLVLSSGKLEKLNEHLIMPYESHLKDIYAIARQNAQATHTTSNSIRHVLETICRFDAPKAGLEDYFNGIAELKGNEFVYSLMHDGSHGVLRTDKPFTPEIIQRGCEAVIQFIDSKFEGQVEHVANP